MHISTGVDTYRNLAETKELADKANRAKSEFLSRMSHELRTPLNAILGFGQVLEQRNLEPKAKEGVHYILKGGRHLLQLINEVLDLARVESGHTDISLEPVDVSAVVTECLDLARVLSDERQVELTFEVGQPQRLFVWADLRRLKQVILNLLSNGIKYNFPGGRVTVECQSLPGMFVKIAFMDTGRGIRPEDISKLFVPFERIDAEDSAIEGTGLGLSLTSRLVELMGGRIEVQSSFGAGSTFSVELPECTPSVEEEPPQSINEQLFTQIISPGANKVVLCIEDNPLNIRLFEAIFSGRPNIRLVTATQGTTGLEIAVRQRPDLVLLDLNLPDVSGVQILRTLRQSEGLERLPIIIVSADATQGQISSLLSAGADAYLTKPINVADLLSAVDAALAAAESPQIDGMI